MVAAVVAMMLVGCTTTKIQYVEKVVYVAVKTDESLFQLDDMPSPPPREKFIFLTPTNPGETITLLKGQRDMLVDYGIDLVRDNGICRARLSRIKKLQAEQVKIIEKKGKL